MMALSKQEICKILGEEICHPDHKNIELDPLGFTGDYYCSKINRANVILKNQQRKRILIKTIDAEVLDYTLEQFKIERFMYQTCLPEIFPQGKDLFPGVHLLRDNIFVFDDETEDGYQMGPKGGLDVKHCELVLRGLGRLHAASLVYKLKNPERFYEMAPRLHDPGPSINSAPNSLRIMGLDALRLFAEKYPQRDKEESIERIRQTLEALEDVMESLYVGEEPWQVICHGDFNRNNMLFKYDSKGDPVAVKFIDLQTSRIASPLIDLAFFWYVNATYTLRNQSGEYLMKVYFSQIEESLRVLDEEKIYTQESFGKECVARSFFGFLCSCNFVRTCLATIEDIQKVKWDPKSEEYWRENKLLGGKEADDWIADMVADFIDKKHWPAFPKE